MRKHYVIEIRHNDEKWLIEYAFDKEFISHYNYGEEHITIINIPSCFKPEHINAVGFIEHKFEIIYINKDGYHDENYIHNVRNSIIYMKVVPRLNLIN